VSVRVARDELPGVGEPRDLVVRIPVDGEVHTCSHQMPCREEQADGGHRYCHDGDEPPPGGSNQQCGERHREDRGCQAREQAEHRDTRIAVHEHVEGIR
jgi:hypothetical protein